MKSKSFFVLLLACLITISAYGQRADTTHPLHDSLNIAIHSADGPMRIHQWCSQDQDVNEVAFGRGTHAIHLASSLGRIDIVQTLVESCNADVNQQDHLTKTALFHAHLYFEVAEYLIEKGADVNHVRDTGEGDYRSTQPLIMSALATNPYAKYIELLLEAGVRLDTANTSGITPLIWAVQKERYDILDLFFEYRTEVGKDMVDKAGFTAASIASDEKMVAYLRSKGVY